MAIRTSKSLSICVELSAESARASVDLAGHGVYDATKDVRVVAQWWGRPVCRSQQPRSSPVAAMVVLDVDPRNGGDQSIAALEHRHEPSPETLTTISGRGDGGRHLFYRRPWGKISAKRLGQGIDIKTSFGYVVLPPSIHPDTVGRAPESLTRWRPRQYGCSSYWRLSRRLRRCRSLTDRFRRSPARAPGRVQRKHILGRHPAAAWLGVP
ncbi:bifunctional DNA primase/polymerase [Mycobacterium sp. URHB0021]|jgi:bifunctional DNA primase/polymerase-like protein